MLATMALILDGKSEHVAHARGKIGTKIRFLTAIDLIECLILLKLLPRCAPISKLPSNRSTMMLSKPHIRKRLDARM